jgi:hypothetical protein
MQVIAMGSVASLASLALLALSGSGCGSVQDQPGVDARDDGGPADAPVDAPDLSPRLVFVTSTAHSGALGGLAGADGICQARAQAAGLPGMYKAWLADASQSPATRMTRGLGPYQLVTSAVIAQGWNDLTDGNLAARIDRTEMGVQLGGVGCNVSQGTCHFVCEGGEAWSNVDGAGSRRASVGDCGGLTGGGGGGISGTAGNVGKTDVMWTAGSCTSIGCSSALPLFCIQQ